jgi:hypothetical protein
MKVMYVGCRPAGANELSVATEATELARLFRKRKGEAVDFVAFPQLSIEGLALEIGSEQPDILHIASHSEDGRLLFAVASGGSADLSAETLVSYLSVSRPPVLVYLNGCTSQSIAEKLTAKVKLAIGTTHAITNLTARASAILFYDRIFSGSTVQNAFDAGRVTMEAMQGNTLSSKLYAADGVQPHLTRLYNAPCIVAKFIKDKFSSDSDGAFRIEFGLAGCPSNTSQLVFFADETSGVDPEDTCITITGAPVLNEFWDDELEFDDIYGDYRIYASAVTKSGEIISVASTVSQALEAFYDLTNTEVSPQARGAIEILRTNNGSRVAQKALKPKKKKAKR